MRFSSRSGRRRKPCGFRTNAPVGQLVTGEVTSWRVGVCQIVGVRKDSKQVSLENQPHYLTVVGERGPIKRIKLTVDSELEEIDRELDEAISNEMDSL